MSLVIANNIFSIVTGLICSLLVFSDYYISTSVIHVLKFLNYIFPAYKLLIFSLTDVSLLWNEKET